MTWLKIKHDWVCDAPPVGRYTVKLIAPNNANYAAYLNDRHIINIGISKDAEFIKRQVDARIKLSLREKTYRCSTESGDHYTIEAPNIEQARKIARERSEGVKHTVYEEKAR